MNFPCSYQQQCKLCKKLIQRLRRWWSENFKLMFVYIPRDAQTVKLICHFLMSLLACAYEMEEHYRPKQ